MKPFEGTLAEFFAGEGLFETILVEGRRVAFGPEHLARLRNSAAETGLPAPPPDASVLATLDRHLADRGLADATVRANLRVDRHSFTFLARPVDAGIVGARERGVGAITFRLDDDRRGRARHKWVERKPLAAAMRKAGESAAEEALLVAPDGCLLEGASSNVFCVVGGTLRTPPTDTRILPGVTRSAICSIASGLRIPLAEGAIDVQSVFGADEVFLTSAVRMLVPVVALDGQPVGTGRPGPISRRLGPLLWARAFGEPG
jgi:D-alanine transaminase